MHNKKIATPAAISCSLYKLLASNELFPVCCYDTRLAF